MEMQTTTEPRKSTTLPDALEAMLQDLARRGTQKWQDTFDTIIAFGQFLIDAKAAAGHGNFSRLFKDHAKPVERPMPINLHTGEQLIKIAKDPVLSNSRYKSSLPPHWTTLSLLTQFSQEEKERLIREGKISAGLTQEQAHILLYYQTAEVKGVHVVLAKVAAHQKKLARRAVAKCLCRRIRCGSVHTDQRLISRSGPPDHSQKNESTGTA